MHFSDILVMGATGRIGRVLQQCWAADAVGRRVLWQGRAVIGLDAAAHQVILAPLSEPAGLAQAAAGRQILCLAGGVPGRGDLDDNWRLAAAALHAAPPGGRVLLCSSAAVYGNQPGLLAENAPMSSLHAYGLSKVGMEQRATALAADLGVELCLLRIGNIAGLDAILGGWAAGFQLDQFADGSTPVRSYIGGATLARVLADLLMQPQLPAVLNLAQPEGIQMGALLQAAGLSWNPRPAPDTAIARVVLDTGLLQDLMPLAAADAGQMVQEWRTLEPHMNKERA